MAALGKPVVVVASGGMPVVNATGGQPAVVTSFVGQPVTVVTALGKPMALMMEADGAAYTGAIALDQVAPVVSSYIATYGGAVATGAMHIYVHRFGAQAGATDPTGFTQVIQHIQSTDPVLQVSKAFAAGGERTVTGPFYGTDRAAAVSYSRAVSTGTPVKGNATSSTVTFPSITLSDPGRSWVVGVAWCGTANTPSATTAPAWRAGSGVSGNINIVDSNGPVSSWSGYTLSLGSSSVWAAWSFELLRA